MNSLKSLFLTVCLFSSTAGFAQGAPLDMDALWNSLKSNRPFRNQSGWLSDAEIKRIENLDKNSRQYQTARQEALDRYLLRYQSDVKALNANPDRVLPHVEAMKTMKSQGFDVSSASVERVHAEVRASVTPTGNQVALGMRQKMMGRLGKGGGLFSLVDVGLLGLAAKKDADQQALREQIQKDARAGKCPQDPSDEYVKALIFEEVSVQKSILDRCHPADRGMPRQMTAKVMALRDTYTAQFSGGQARCEYREGKPVITTVSEAGTQQQILFDENGQFDRLRILPQPASKGPSKYEGSYLEYSHKPKDHSVSYYAVTKKNPTATGPDLSSSHMKNEPLNSFSARVHCTVNGCDGETPEYGAILQEESLQTTPSKPFGAVTENKEFLIQSAKALAQFRLGLEERWGLQQNFRNMCLALGSIPPKQEKVPSLTLPGKVPKQSSPETIR